MNRPGSWRRGYLSPLLSMQNDLNQLLEELVRPATTAASPSSAATGGADWAPPIDLSDDGKEFVLVADLPGVEPATIDLSVSGDILTLRGLRAVADTTAGHGVLRERPAGPFLRQVRLAAEVDIDSIQAESRHGVLTVRLPRRTAAQPRTIRVEPAG